MNSDSTVAWNALGALTLGSLSPSLLNTINAYGIPYSNEVLKTAGIPISSDDRVDNFQAADGSEVEVHIQSPNAAKMFRVYKVPPLSSGEDVGTYFSNAVSNAQKGGYGKIVFPRATYGFTTSASCDAHGAHWSLFEVQDLFIDLQGSTLNFNQPLCIGIHITSTNPTHSSRRIVLSNFSMNWPNTFLSSIGTVVRSHASCPTTKNWNCFGDPCIDVKLDPQFVPLVNSSTMVEGVTAWDRTNGYVSLTKANLDESIGSGRQNQGQCVAWNSQQGIFTLGNFVGFNLGDDVLLRHYAGEAPAINSDFLSEDIGIENASISGATGSAIVFTMGRGIRISNVKVVRMGGRPTSIDGDGFHINNNIGDILVEGSTVGYQGDDGININASMVPTPPPPPPPRPCSWRIGPNNFSTCLWDPWAWSIGNTVAFFASDFNFLNFGKLAGITPLGGQPPFTVAVSPNLPQSTRFFSNLSFGGGRYLIRNNTFEHNRARGALLQTSHGWVVGNTFTGQTMYSIYVTASPFWGEGPGAQNLLIENNVISNTGNFTSSASNGNRLGSVVVATEDTNANQIPSSDPLHKNVIFYRNTVQNVPGPGFFLSTANNLIFTRNNLANTNQSHTDITRYGTATTAGSVVITHAHNVFYGGNTLTGTSGAISVDTTSTTGVHGN